jgi:hypothetical protein
LQASNDGDDEMKTTIELAREAGFAIDVSKDPNSPPSWWGAGHDDKFKAFEALVRADEREALAVLETDAHYIFNNPPGETSQDVRDVIEWYSAAIRARGNT